MGRNGSTHKHRHTHILDAEILRRGSSGESMVRKIHLSPAGVYKLCVRRKVGSLLEDMWAEERGRLSSNRALPRRRRQGGKKV